MGYEKLHRDVYVRGGVQTAGNSTFQGNFDVEGNLTVDNTVTASSATKVVYEAVTSTATVAKAYGVSVLSTTKTGTRKFKLGDPVAGYVKHVAIGAITGSSSKVLVRVNSTKVNVVSTAGAAKKSMNFATSGMSASFLGLSTGTWQVLTNVGGAYGSSFST